MKHQILTKKKFLKIVSKLPLKIKTEFLSVIMDKYYTIDYNKVPLKDLVSEFETIAERRFKQVLPFIEATEKNLKILKDGKPL